jgi:hypothetical protein
MIAHKTELVVSFQSGMSWSGNMLRSERGAL